MKNERLLASLLLGITLGLGVAAAGYLVGDALYRARAAERYVSVRGLAERNVDADLVVWPLTLVKTGNDLAALQSDLDADRRVVRGFLAEQGFTKEEISESPPEISDFYAQGFQGGQRPEYRYKEEVSLTVRTTQVDKVKQAMERSGDLVKNGVVLAMDYGRQTDFLFTSLNAIKPDMIAEATRNARKAAEQFARDSESKVGGIRSARQGLFTIENRDMNSPHIKTVRVVTSIEYFLVED